MKAWITTAAQAASIAVGAAAPAAADENNYLRLLDDRYDLSTQQLLAEGYKVCEATQRMGSSDAVNMVYKDLAVTVAAAEDIVAAARAYLGPPPLGC
jgi:hypothetical protein